MKTPPPEPPRRGRPPRSRQQAAAGRERILDAARSLFAQDGYEGVSMRRIAAAAGCSPAALYLLFPNKRHLLRHLWDAVFADLAARLERTWRDRAAPDRIEALCLAFIDFWLQRPDDYRAIFLIQDRLQHAHDRYFVDSSEVLPRLAILDLAITEAQARGELRDGDPVAIRDVLLCGVQGVALNLITIPEFPWGDAGALPRATVRALLAGLA